MEGKAIIVAGSYGELVCREKGGEHLELGELLATEGMLLQVTDLSYGSQINQQNRELLSGLVIEDDVELALQDASLRTYTMANLKPLVTLPDMRPPKRMPALFAPLRPVLPTDLSFPAGTSALTLGKVRSGSYELAVPVTVDTKLALTHHVLIAATTGRGKSNTMKVLLQDLLDKDVASVLVFDPHAEYADALSGKRLVVYTQDPRPGEYTLKISLAVLKPVHFDGVAEWTDAQREAMRLYHKKYGERWVEHVLLDEEPLRGVLEGTLAVLKRRLSLLLSLDVEGGLICHGVFDNHAGTHTITDIVTRLRGGSVVIIETASLPDAAEVLMASLVTTEAYSAWKGQERTLAVCLEEAPRFIGEDALKRGPNVFSQISREGRKFGVGLIAITQLPSLIPRTVLANMNTKIIMGIEMGQERKAIIDSSPHDLSRDDRVIASLQKGEAIISSIFTPFAVPVKVPMHVKRQAVAVHAPGLRP